MPLLPVVRATAAAIMIADFLPLSLVADAMLWAHCFSHQRTAPQCLGRQALCFCSASFQLVGASPLVIIYCCRMGVPILLLLPLCLPDLTNKVLLFDADNVLAGDDDQAEITVCHVHLDRLGVSAGLLGCFEELLGRRLTVFVGMCQDDITVLEEYELGLSTECWRARGGVVFLPTGSVHLNSPQNMRSSVVWIRSFLLSRDPRKSCPSTLLILSSELAILQVSSQLKVQDEQ